MENDDICLFESVGVTSHHLCWVTARWFGASDEVRIRKLS